MTREEAIKILKGANNHEYTWSEYCEAYNMAIKALEQEPTTKNDLGVDCISRVEVIDYLCKHCPDDGECFKDCDEIKHLRQMPSVTPQELILDKIRAEIENDWQLKKYPSSPFSCGLRQAIEIIDKYKAESKPQESEDKE